MSDQALKVRRCRFQNFSCVHQINFLADSFQRIGRFQPLDRMGINASDCHFTFFRSRRAWRARGSRRMESDPQSSQRRRAPQGRQQAGGVIARAVREPPLRNPERGRAAAQAGTAPLGQFQTHFDKNRQIHGLFRQIDSCFPSFFHPFDAPAPSPNHPASLPSCRLPRARGASRTSPTYPLRPRPRSRKCGQVRANARDFRKNGPRRASEP